MGHVNASVDHVERPLITPDEALRLKPPQKKSEADLSASLRLVKMLIFVSGHDPILGTQMLYFLDPVFTTNLGLAVTTLIQRSSSRPCPQSPRDRGPSALKRRDSPDYIR